MYCRRRVGAPPADRPRTPDVEVTFESDGEAVLDDDWEVGNFGDEAVDCKGKPELLRQIRSYCEAASEDQTRYVKDIHEVADRSCLATLYLSSERRKVSNMEEEVREVIRKFRHADARETTLKFIVPAKTEDVAENFAEATNAIKIREGYDPHLEAARPVGEDAVSAVRVEMQEGVEARAATSDNLEQNTVQ